MTWYCTSGALELCSSSTHPSLRGACCKSLGSPRDDVGTEMTHTGGCRLAIG